MRKINYLRISVTDRCNFTCSYCRPSKYTDYYGRDDIAQFDDVVRFTRLLTDIGIDTVRFTGGEPLLRRDLPVLIKKIGALPQIKTMALSTNASLLLPHIPDLKDAGITKINISIDSFRELTFRNVSGGGDLKTVITGIEESIAAGFLVKLNCVLLRGINENEIMDFIDFAIEKKIIIRFIELMPFDPSYFKKHFLSLKEIFEKNNLQNVLKPVGEKFGAGPSVYYTATGNEQIGFISPISAKFCDDCNRIRLSSKGVLKLCLDSELGMDLKNLARKGLSDLELLEKIKNVLQIKPESHTMHERIEKLNEFDEKGYFYSLSKIGG